MITFKKFNFQNYKDCFVVTDATLQKLYDITGDNVFVLPCGEKAKKMFYVQKLCGWLLAKGAQKDCTLVAVGGGSVGDVVGFTASVYKRGVKLLHVPTTLLAQIDSSIGGKTAVDLNGVKNAVGTFYKADTLVDVSFLSTLPKKQWKNGQGELLKYRMLSAEIDQIALGGNILQTVKACANYKQKICRADPLDKNQRHILNFGHTIGHALELSCNISHGEAVANGLFYETLLSHKLGLVENAYVEKWQNQVKNLFEIHPFTPQILQLTLQDKKNVNGEVCFVLPTTDGFCTKFIPFKQLLLLLQDA